MHLWLSQFGDSVDRRALSDCGRDQGMEDSLYGSYGETVEKEYRHDSRSRQWWLINKNVRQRTWRRETSKSGTAVG